MNDDGHTTECTWQKCAHPESKLPCPFVKTNRTINPILEITNKREKPVITCTSSPHGRHEWRERADYRVKYYCVFCLKTT